MNKTIILNRIKTPDGTVLTSYHRHDYKIHLDTITGLHYMVDGGHEYLRRIIYDHYPYEELSVYSDSPFEIIRESLLWGTYGIKHDKPLTHVKLCDMETSHINNVLIHVHNLDETYKEFFNKEIEYRKNLI